jgi:hypothetical protein
MSDGSSNKKSPLALFISVAANIFLAAFILGRFSAHDMPHPPMGPPDMFQPDRHREFAPPTFGPGDLFAPWEIHADEARMHENFEKMDALRKAFAEQLQTGPMSKEEALKHFASIDGVMEGVKKEAQERAAEKISTMSESERNHFAQLLLSRE